MYLRDLPGTTLTEFADHVNDTSESNQVAGTEIQVLLTDAEPHFEFANVTVPASREGIESLGRHLGVPATFLYPSDREADREEQQFVLQRRLARMGNAVSIHHNPEGIQGVYKPGQVPINPRRVVEVAMRVMDPASPLIEYRATADEMFFDVAVPFTGLATGDPAVGDLTAAGLRFTQNRARNLTPTVDEFMYRLVCTNGMSLLDSTLPKVDGRLVESVDEVMAALERRAQEAFARVEQQIEHFYDLRNQPVVGDASLALLRMGTDYGIPDRTVARIAREALPSILEDGATATMFDLVNLLTNEANNPSVSVSGRRALEAAGGHVVATHSDRCTHCQSVLNT